MLKLKFIINSVVKKLLPAAASAVVFGVFAGAGAAALGGIGVPAATALGTAAAGGAKEKAVNRKARRHDKNNTHSNFFNHRGLSSSLRHRRSIWSGDVRHRRNGTHSRRHGKSF